MTGTRKWNSGVIARGSIYVANDDKVYAFRVPGGTPTPTPTVKPTPTATPMPTTSPTASPTPIATPRVTPRPRPRPRGRPTPPPRPADAPIRIVDQNGREVPSGAARSTPTPRPRPTPRGRPVPPHGTFDVTVGQGFAFVPNEITIDASDTVRWSWASSGHSVSSGNPCTIDGQFCSPDNTNCQAGSLSNAGTVYEFTFTQPGTYSYFCAAHCSIGMTGVINVAP
jgi:plastocyanin